MATAAVSGLEWKRRTETCVFVLLGVGAAGTVATVLTAKPSRTRSSTLAARRGSS